MQWVARINDVKYSAFCWRYELSVPKKLVMALAMAALTGLVAQAKFQLPWTPVPVTGQTFGVLLSGVLLGRWWGGASMAIYAGLGAIGLPWFAGWSAGIGVLGGATGGYIIGFILASLFVGYFTDKFVRSRSFLTMLGLMLFANFVLVHGPGLFQLNQWLVLVKGNTASIGQLLMMGTVPFIAGDVTKAVLAAIVARAVTPKQAYGGEVDKGKWAHWRIP
ncbi:MAG: biotin transporter BioY [Chloroflexi bacterium]|nr:biotin transporter BioY [Chloroflexota bacterium]